MVLLRAGAHDAYYRYLNCGYRIPLVGGTDKMDGEVPVGLYRTYAYLGDEPFDYERWCAAVRAGRTFLSGGPILTLSVEGHGIGDVVRIPGPGTVEIEASAEGIFPMHTLQLIHDGAVVAAAEHPSGSRKVELRATVEVREHGWLAVRCGGPGYFDADTYLDSWLRARFAHTSPVYVAVGGDWWRFDPDVAQSMRTMTEGSLAYLADSAVRHPAGSATHHHGEDDHAAFLARPFHEAIDAITRRMGDPSDPALGRRS
jgi:hypothetical protein